MHTRCHEKNLYFFSTKQFSHVHIAVMFIVLSCSGPFRVLVMSERIVRYKCYFGSHLFQSFTLTPTHSFPPCFYFSIPPSFTSFPAARSLSPHVCLSLTSSPLPELREGRGKLPLPQGCPSRVYKLMTRCWASSPKDRSCFSDIVSALSELPSESKV